MKVLLGATAVWLIISIVLGWTIFLMSMKGVVWPFALVFLIVAWLVKRIGCSAH
jgi:hypothetical protein